MRGSTTTTLDGTGGYVAESPLSDNHIPKLMPAAGREGRVMSQELTNKQQERERLREWLRYLLAKPYREPGDRSEIVTTLTELTKLEAAEPSS